jgi:HSP20 family molecular chaperone IbpA
LQDIVDTPQAFNITVDAPGMEDGDITIIMEAGDVTIAGKNKADNEDMDKVHGSRRTGAQHGKHICLCRTM